MLHLVERRIPELYENFDINNLNGSGNFQEVIALVKEYCSNLLDVTKTGRNLYIFSPENGNGKTSSAYWVLQQFQGPRLDANGVPQVYKIASCKFANYLKFCKDYDEESKAAKKVIETVPFLLLDDVSPWASNKNEHQDKLELILLMMYRREHLLPTIFTSNLTRDRFNKFFGSTATSKVLENFQYIKIDGVDMRPVIYGGEDNGEEKESIKEAVTQES